MEHEEHAGSVVECLTRDQRVTGSHCTVPLSKASYPLLSIGLIQEDRKMLEHL